MISIHKHKKITRGAVIKATTVFVNDAYLHSCVRVFLSVCKLFNKDFSLHAPS